MTLRGARHFLEMIRFSHTLFALPFALLSAILAWNENARAGSVTPFRWQELVGIVLCMVFARSAAMARPGDRRAQPAHQNAPLAGWNIEHAVCVGHGHCVRGGLCGEHVVVLAKLVAAVFVGAGVGLAVGLQLHQTLYGAGALLVGGGADVGADRRVDRDTRQFGLAAVGVGGGGAVVGGGVRHHLRLPRF
jgi:hypothetical protein